MKQVCKNNSFYCQFDDVLKEYLSGGTIGPDFFISSFSNKQNLFILFEKKSSFLGNIPLPTSSSIFINCGRLSVFVNNT